MSVCVRPAWLSAASPSDRASELLIAEWRELGLLDDEAVSGQIDDGARPETASEVFELMRTRMQHRSRSASFPLVLDARSARSMSFAAPLRLLADVPADTPVGDTKESDSFSEIEGRLLSFGEEALIGVDTAGHPIRERFLPGSLRLVDDVVAVLNLGHDRTRLLGHLTSVRDNAGAAMCRARFVIDTTTGRDSAALMRAGTLTKLSIEFLPHKPTMKIEQRKDGGTLITHRDVGLIGCALVTAGAYSSARVTRFLDPTQFARQREHDRQQTRRRLTALSS